MFSELTIAIMLYEIRLPWAATLFKELRAANEVRPFKLVLLLRMSHFHEAQKELKADLESAAMKVLLNFLDSPPTIRFTQSPHYRWDFFDF